MELLAELGSRSWINGSGKKDSRKFGLFQCPVCGATVEKSISHGKRDKNCGSKECRKATFEPNKQTTVIDGNVVHTGGSFSHGYARDPDHRTFSRVYYAMRNRCTNPNDKSYMYYGAKGIKVCDEWSTLSQFTKDMFPVYKQMMLEWDGTTSGRPSIDRIDPFQDYCVDNCQWIRYGDNVCKDKTIPVVRMDFDGNILESYASITDAAKFVSVYGCRTMKACASNIGECCRGNASEHVGYKWAFATSKESAQKHNCLI